jgi:WD40 repeat protein
VSDSYSCHSWLDGNSKLIIGTSKGELLVLENSGEYDCILEDSPFGDIKIECIIPFARGFICGCDEGYVVAYEKIDEAGQAPFRRIALLQVKLQDNGQNNLNNSADNFKINAMALVTTEDMLYMVTESNQLLKVAINLDGSGDEIQPQFEYVICSFHSKAITGLDTCIRKELIATCSKDKSIRVWSYQHNTLELSHVANEEIFALAFHPSGFHLVASLQDKILLMNVLSKKIDQFIHFGAKHCREIQFSNGGHLFACVNVNAINVYNFYTNELVVNYKDHNNKPKCIEWFEDDSGFVSCGLDGSIYSCPLHSVDPTGKGQRDFDSDIVNK